MKGEWVNLRELPGNMSLDGLRIRHKKHVLGYIRSAWSHGLWLTEKPTGEGARPWFPPDGKRLSDVADDLQVEVLR